MPLYNPASNATEHIADAVDAHDASAISFASAGTIAATTVQAAIEEVASEAVGGLPAVVLATFGYTVVQGTWQQSVDAGQPLAFYLHSTTDAQNDEVTYPVVLSAGTYKVIVSHVRGTNRGIYTLSLDGGSIGTVDGYHATAGYNGYGEIAGVAVATGGLKTLSVKMATKNASSSAFRGIFTAIVFSRTA